MKNYKKGLLAVMILSAMSLMAAEDKTIYVTTLLDEDGENSKACSLREAIKTAKLDKSYGGCNVGRTLRLDGSAADVIQLEAGEYKLDRELIVESAVKIYGKSPYSYNTKSPITFLYPTREALKTTISGQSKTRLFNTLESQVSLNIQNLILKDGYATKNSYDQGNGGTFYVAGPLGVINSEIVGSKAEAEGGAIYATALNNEKNIQIVDSLIRNNVANTYGSILAMDCSGNLGSTQTGVDIIRSSLIQNGSSHTASILDFCGAAKVNIQNSTIAQNTASAQGYILRMAHHLSRPLTSSSVLNASNNTIVENVAKSVLYYDDLGVKTLKHNVLAFNKGLSCEYALNAGSPPPAPKISFTSDFNAIEQAGESRCVLPELEKEKVSTNIDVSNTALEKLLTPFIEPSINNRYLGMYYPVDNQTDTDLVDIGDKNCIENDQRGIERVVDATLLFNPVARNTCDIGSIEMRRFTAADIVGLKNVSLTELLNSYQKNIDDLQSILNHKDTLPEELPGLKEELREFEELLKYTKQHQKYRAIYIDPFKLAMPQENLEAKEIIIQALNAQNYDVEVKSLGVGGLTGEGDSLTVTGHPEDPNLKCEWKPDLQRIIMYRTDGKVTDANDMEFCKYTLKDKKTGVSSSGILKVTFANIQPIIKSDVYAISPDKYLSVTVNPLENDSDDGDGPAINGKPAFYRNNDGLEIPIRIKMPAGVSVSAEREGPCPGDYQGERCYGGQLTFKVKNSLSQADYTIIYNIFDADGLMSADAEILLRNTLKNTNNTSSGGGSFAIFGLLGLVGLVGYRRWKK